MAEPFPEKSGMVDVVAELGEVKLGGAEMIGALGLEEFGTYPVEYAGTLGDGGLLLVLRRHLSEMKLLFDQAPSLEYVVVGKHVGSEVFQIESALLGLRVMAIHAIGFQQGKHVLVVSKLHCLSQPGRTDASVPLAVLETYPVGGQDGDFRSKLVPKPP